jgi:hypothetical protein
MGKGSSPRPFNVSNEEYSNRWDAIFQKDEKKNETQNLESDRPDNSCDSGGSDNTQREVGQTQTS